MVKVDMIVEEITPAIGARITASTEQVLADGGPERILELLNERGVLVFPKLFLSDEGLADLANRLGDMEAATVTADGSDANRLGIYRIERGKTDTNHADYVAGNDYWHMDGTSYDVPGKATLLKCESPPKSGGETDFAHLFAAFAALPTSRQNELKQLEVIHCMRGAMRYVYDAPTEADYARWDAVFPETPHPLVWRMRDGRHTLLIGSTAYRLAHHEDDAGRAVLEELLAWCTQPQFTYQHVWQQGDLVVFNNPGLLHRSRPYDEHSGRILHRATVKGAEPIVAA